MVCSACMVWYVWRGGNGGCSPSLRTSMSRKRQTLRRKTYPELCVCPDGVRITLSSHTKHRNNYIMLNNIDSALQLIASHHSLRGSAFSPRELPNSNTCCFLTLSRVYYMSFLSESHSVPKKGYYWPHFTEKEPLKPLRHLTHVHNQFSDQEWQNQVSVLPYLILESGCNHNTPFIWTHWSLEV